MKSRIGILALLIVATGFSAHGQAWMSFDTGAHQVYDEYTTPGVGVRSAGTVDAGFLWAATGTTDPLPSVGTQFGLGQEPAVQQVATNGVSQILNEWSTITSMLSSGWHIAYDLSDGNVPATATTGPSVGTVTYNGDYSFALAGSTAEDMYEIVVIGWDVGSGLSAIVNQSSLALGWSNPFTFQTGVSDNDPNGLGSFNFSGMNQFGVAPVPEPSTLALAGVGGLSLLLFRRRS